MSVKAKSTRPSLKNNYSKNPRGKDQVVESLPSKCKTQIQNLVSSKKLTIKIKIMFIFS
jgi:hypothetical protein